MKEQKSTPKSKTYPLSIVRMVPKVTFAHHALKLMANLTSRCFNTLHVLRHEFFYFQET